MDYLVINTTRFRQACLSPCWSNWVHILHSCLIFFCWASSLDLLWATWTPLRSSMKVIWARASSFLKQSMTVQMEALLGTEGFHVELNTSLPLFVMVKSSQVISSHLFHNSILYSGLCWPVCTLQPSQENSTEWKKICTSASQPLFFSPVHSAVCAEIDGRMTVSQTMTIYKKISFVERFCKKSNDISYCIYGNALYVGKNFCSFLNSYIF